MTRSGSHDSLSPPIASFTPRDGMGHASPSSLWTYLLSPPLACLSLADIPLPSMVDPDEAPPASVLSCKRGCDELEDDAQRQPLSADTSASPPLDPAARGSLPPCSQRPPRLQPPPGKRQRQDAPAAGELHHSESLPVASTIDTSASACLANVAPTRGPPRPGWPALRTSSPVPEESNSSASRQSREEGELSTASTNPRLHPSASQAPLGAPTGHLRSAFESPSPPFQPSSPSELLLRITALRDDERRRSAVHAELPDLPKLSLPASSVSRFDQPLGASGSEPAPAGKEPAGLHSDHRLDDPVAFADDTHDFLFVPEAASPEHVAVRRARYFDRSHWRFTDNTEGHPQDLGTSTPEARVLEPSPPHEPQASSLQRGPPPWRQRLPPKYSWTPRVPLRDTFERPSTAATAGTAHTPPPPRDSDAEDEESATSSVTSSSDSSASGSSGSNSALALADAPSSRPSTLSRPADLPVGAASTEPLADRQQRTRPSPVVAAKHRVSSDLGGADPAPLCKGAHLAASSGGRDKAVSYRPSAAATPSGSSVGRNIDMSDTQRSLFAKMERAKIATEAVLPARPRPRSAGPIYEPRQIWPDTSVIDATFDELPDPSRQVNVPPFTHRFLYKGRAIKLADRYPAQQELESQITASQLLTRVFTVGNIYEYNRSFWVDVTFTSPDDFRAAKALALTYRDKPFQLFKSGAPINKDQLFIRVTGMPASFDHPSLFEYFLGNYRAFFQVQAIWILQHAGTDKFAGISYVLGRFIRPDFGPASLRGFAKIDEYEVEFQFRNRPDYCITCRSLNRDGHTNQTCPRSRRRT